MILFFNTFLSYLLLVIISAIIIVLAIFCGKKLRDYKDNKKLAADNAESFDKSEE